MSSSLTFSKSLSGYWPFTAPINYCEDDYVISFYIAEFYNTFTNISYIIAGINGFIIYKKYRHILPINYLFAAIMFISTGISSGLFHGSLTLTALKMDELSETMAMLCFLYSFTSKYYQWILYLHAIIASAGIIMIETDFCEIHLTIITILALLSIGRIAKNTAEIDSEQWRSFRDGLRAKIIVCGLIAVSAFAFDKFACDMIKSTWILNQIEFHAFGWHLFGGIAVNYAFIAISILHLIKNGIVNLDEDALILKTFYGVLDYDFIIVTNKGD